MISKRSERVCKGCRQLSEECICDIVRKDLIAHLRQQIANGTYLTQGKWKIALEKLLKDL